MKKELIENKFIKNPILIEKILDSISSAVFLIDEDRNVLKYNNAFISMFNIKFTLNDMKCFRTIDIGSKKSGVECE